MSRGQGIKNVADELVSIRSAVSAYAWRLVKTQKITRTLFYRKT